MGTRQAVVVVVRSARRGMSWVVVRTWTIGRWSTHVVIPTVSWYITPCRSGSAGHGRTDIHRLVEVPVGIVTHVTYVVTATEGVEATWTNCQVETCTVGVHRVDTELNMVS